MDALTSHFHVATGGAAPPGMRLVEHIPCGGVAFYLDKFLRPGDRWRSQDAMYPNYKRPEYGTQMRCAACGDVIVDREELLVDWAD